MAHRELNLRLSACRTTVRATYRASRPALMLALQEALAGLLHAGRRVTLGGDTSHYLELIVQADAPLQGDLPVALMIDLDYRGDHVTLSQTSVPADVLSVLQRVIHRLDQWLPRVPESPRRVFVSCGPGQPLRLEPVQA